MDSDLKRWKFLYIKISQINLATTTLIVMQNSIQETVDCLLGGGAGLLPTDTVYGLAASPTLEEGIDRIFALKDRPKNRFLPILVASRQQLEDLGLEVNEAAQKLLDSEFMPGGLTLVLGFKDKPTVKWLEGREEVAVRIPNHAWLLEVIAQTGPLLATSANRHGMQQPTTVPEILEQLEGKPDCVVDEGEIETIPSTIINCRTKPPKIERLAAISEEALFRVLES